MKRQHRILYALLLLALCLSVSACWAAQEPAGTGSGAAGEETPTPPPEPLHLDELNVEFAAYGRDVDKLLSLRADFPWALTDALERQGVTVDQVGVTFGTSGAATVTAMRGGAVQIAFLPAEDYYPFRTGIVAAVEEGVTPELSLGLAVVAATDDPGADERLTEALRAALPDLAPVLASYTSDVAKGRYSCDADRLDQLGLLYEQSAAANRHEDELLKES